MKKLCVLIFLMINSWIDIKKRQVSLFLIVCLAFAGTVWRWRQGGSLQELLICLGPGLFFAGLSILTAGALGMGDGWLLLSLGLILKPEELYGMITGALLCSAVCAGILTGILKKNRNTEIPFVPFLLLGYVGGLVL